MSYDCLIYLVEYEGQTESAYTWWARSWGDAEYLMRELQEQHPDREWFVVEKDVS